MALTITKVEPSIIDIGEITEVLIVGTGLDETGLIAFVMNGAGKEIDDSILIGHPLPDDTFADRFPITIDVPGGVSSSVRKIGIRRKSAATPVLTEDGKCAKKTECFIFEKGIKLE